MSANDESTIVTIYDRRVTVERLPPSHSAYALARAWLHSHPDRLSSAEVCRLPDSRLRLPPLPLGLRPDDHHRLSLVLRLRQRLQCLQGRHRRAGSATGYRGTRPRRRRRPQTPAAPLSAGEGGHARLRGDNDRRTGGNSKASLSGFPWLMSFVYIAFSFTFNTCTHLY